MKDRQTDRLLAAARDCAAARDVVQVGTHTHTHTHMHAHTHTQVKCMHAYKMKDRLTD
jgi:hypothetical protein